MHLILGDVAVLQQVGVPISVAMSLTFPETVTEHNITRLRQNVLNGAQSGIALPAFVISFMTRHSCCVHRCAEDMSRRLPLLPLPWQGCTKAAHLHCQRSRDSCAGCSTWPGANLIVLPSGAKFVLRFQDRSRFVATLKVPLSASLTCLLQGSKASAPHCIQCRYKC